MDKENSKVPADGRIARKRVNLPHLDVTILQPPVLMRASEFKARVRELAVIPDLIAIFGTHVDDPTLLFPEVQSLFASVACKKRLADTEVQYYQNWLYNSIVALQHSFDLSAFSGYLRDFRNWFRTELALSYGKPQVKWSDEEWAEFEPTMCMVNSLRGRLMEAAITNALRGSLTKPLRKEECMTVGDELIPRMDSRWLIFLLRGGPNEDLWKEFYALLDVAYLQIPPPTLSERVQQWRQRAKEKLSDPVRHPKTHSYLDLMAYTAAYVPKRADSLYDQ